MHFSARSRAVAVVSTGVLASVLGSGVAQADVDRVDSFVDGSGATVEVTQSDTYINGVVPLDGSPLTREWFHNGRVSVAALGADDFAGTLSVGYQFAYPMSIGGKITVSFNTPQLSSELSQKTKTEEVTVTPDPETDPDGVPVTTTETTTTTELTNTLEATTPEGKAELSIAPGPGTQEVEVASGDIEGALTELQFAGIHGSATGVLGNLTVRPFVKVTSDSGSYVVSYGDPQILG
ncbi:hypothetical protein CH267_12250 [Rhodococcus sp. 06-621-2]|nr:MULTISPECIES: MspA family porin [unclassified Rhodococcus (in: high G+C Gram-positive bacteria)]OZC55884.1 hypothetical protein CH267_12250 [Rhodococcus sp. 06-621-2]OZD73826.1 hypothetical protein CH263_01295 [Rhodococcus sp. 06-1059B-a]